MIENKDDRKGKITIRINCPYCGWTVVEWIPMREYQDPVIWVCGVVFHSIFTGVPPHGCGRPFAIRPVITARADVYTLEYAEFASGGKNE